MPPFAPVHMTPEIVDANSPFFNPKTCPTHIEVDGYGRVPISIQKKSFWSDTWTAVTPDVHSRVLYTQPVHPRDMVHTPRAVSPAAVLGWALLAGLGGAAMVLGIVSQAPVLGPLLAVVGALAWIIAAVNLSNLIAPPRQVGNQIPAAPQTFRDLNAAAHA